MKEPKNLVDIIIAPPMHWVGDGFPVRQMIATDTLGGSLDPFLMLDYAAPMQFAPTRGRRGVGPHPHRGFETVTIVYQGEVEHRDSTGAGGLIGPGDVQWMTAASGILHEEFHSAAFSRTGGTIEMMQLWVNLPQKFKSEPPGYQTLMSGDIPEVALPNDAGRIRVIAGALNGKEGPARTFTYIDLWDVRLNGGKSAHLESPDGHTLAIAVLHGTVRVGRGAVARPGQLAVFARTGEGVNVTADSDSTLLLMSGKPIGESVAAHGPFVMNTVGEIKKAMLDFRDGKFGTMS
jgi:quercetin 2,3-dioxygenase